MWETDLEMDFNLFKCLIMQVTGSRKSINAIYRFHDEVPETVSCATYLGIDISYNLSWGSHIDGITNTSC